MNSFRNTSVEVALNKGVKWINTPGYILMFSFLFIFPALIFYFFNNKENSDYVVIGTICSIILGIVLPFIWYSYMVVKYKIWANKNVKDIHRFYNDAISKKIINESDFYRKLEIKSKNQKRELDKFYERLKSENTLVRETNVEIENETIFKANHSFNLFLYSLMLIGIVYFYLNDRTFERNAIIFGSISIGLIIYEFYNKNKYQYILKVNRDFIAYKDEEVKIPWKDIKQFEISNVSGSLGGNYNVKFYLDIFTNEKKYSLELDGIYKLGVNKITTVLNENKHRFDIKNQSMR